MKTIGKIITLILFNIYLFAGANISVNKKNIVKGESVVFALEAIGNDVKFPTINDIEGFIVTEIGQQHYTYINNGVVLSKISKKYTFAPTKNVIIPSFDIIIDKKIEKTSPIDIEVTKALQTKDSNFKLEMFVDKSEAFIGEPIKLTLLFYMRANQKVKNNSFVEPKLDGFWSKVISNNETERKGDFVIHKIKYIIFPQKSGLLDVGNAVIELGLVKRGVDTFSMLLERIEYKKIYSNELQIKAKPLPKGLNLYGNFKIEAKIDKKQIKQSEAVNVIYTIKGFGNIDDIPDINLNIPNAEVFKDKPKIVTEVKNSKYYGEYTQKFAIVADNNFTIPPISINYFNGEKIITKKTKPIEISVIKNANKNSEVVLIKPKENLVKTNLEPEVVVKEASKAQKVIYLIIGFLSGVISIIVLYLFNNMSGKYETQPKAYSTLVKKTRNDKELLELLLPFVNQSKEIDLVVRKLEENLYKGFNNKINKKLLAKRIDNYIKKININ